MGKVLRAEQRRFWRRTYEQERRLGISPAEASRIADEAVELWEARKAFEDDDAARLRQDVILLDADLKTLQQLVEFNRRIVAPHWHGRMTAKAADGVIVRAGTQLGCGTGCLLVVTVHATAKDALIVLEVMGAGLHPGAGNTATFLPPIEGVSPTAVLEG